VQSNLDLLVVLPLIAEREERLRRTSLHIRDQEPRNDEIRHRPVRRWVGRQLVRLGSRLAGEAPMRPVRAR
jgi:hypothetical protein